MSNYSREYEDLSARRALTEFVIGKALTGNPLDLQMYIENRRGRLPHADVLTKAATAAIMSTDAGLDVLRPLESAWADLLRKQTFIGRSSGVRYLQRLTPTTAVDVGTAANFIAEGSPIPVVRPTLTDVGLIPVYSLKSIVPFTKESLLATRGNIRVLIERDLTRAVAIGEDSALLDSAAAVAGERPASVLFGLSPVGMGGSPAGIEDDVLALLAAVRGGEAVSPSFVTSPAGARYLSGVRESGVRVFPDVNALGGAILGVPLLVTSGSPDILALIDGDALAVVDEDLSLDSSEQATVQFNSTPTSGADAVPTSLWQSGCFCIRVVRRIAWSLVWADGAAYITLPV